MTEHKPRPAVRAPAKLRAAKMVHRKTAPPTPFLPPHPLAKRSLQAIHPPVKK